MDELLITHAISEIAEPYADQRVNVFLVEPVSVEDEVVRLRGRVLDETQRRELIEGLQARFPKLEIDTQAVETVRKTPMQMRWVSTNLTSVHAGTSFLSEQVTQMLNGTPVEILWEDNRWAYVRQTDGYLGWTYQPYLTATPAPETNHLVIEPVTLLREQPGDDQTILTRVLGGTAACVLDQSNEWAQLELAGGWKGWTPAASLRALNALPQAREARQQQIVADAFRMTGVPYLWGGNSANGIDCSGFAQLLHRWLGITIPRDADMQFESGQAVEPPLEAGDLLFFGEQGEQRRITHVGISLGGWRMIHSSRARNGVQVDDVQSVPHLRDSFLCAATYLGR